MLVTPGSLACPGGADLRSIQAFGWTNPIRVTARTASSPATAGSGSRKLGLSTVPVIESGGSRRLKRAYLLADNKLAIKRRLG